MTVHALLTAVVPHFRFVAARSLFAGAIAAAACAGNGDTDPAESGDDDDAVSPHSDWSGNTACAHGSKVGDIAIHVIPEKNEQSAYTAIQGLVLDSVEPRTVPELVQSVGECQLLRTPTFFCDPPCGAGLVCDATNTCVPQPQARNVGTVSIRGMAIPISMEPGPTNYYTNPPNLPHPAFTAGAWLELDATGGDDTAFVLRGAAVGEVTTTSPDIRVEPGLPVAVSWVTEGGPASVNVKLNINQHGGTPSWVECLVPDTGSFEIPAALVDELFGAGLSGFPSLWLTRRTIDSAELTTGCVEFTVQSELAIQVEVPGVTSCMDDDDCPPGQTCQPDLTCG